MRVTVSWQLGVGSGGIMVEEGDDLEDDILEFGIGFKRMGFIPGFQFFQGVRDAFDEVGLLLDQASEAVGT